MQSGSILATTEQIQEIARMKSRGLKRNRDEHTPGPKPQKVPEPIVDQILMRFIKGEPKTKIADDLTSEDCKLTVKIVSRVLQTNHAKVELLKTEVESRLIDKIGVLAEQIADSIDEKTIGKARLGERSIALGTLIDKRRLLKGESTDNFAVNLSSLPREKLIEYVIDGKISSEDNNNLNKSTPIPDNNINTDNSNNIISRSPVETTGGAGEIVSTENKKDI